MKKQLMVMSLALVLTACGNTAISSSSSSIEDTSSSSNSSGLVTPEGSRSQLGKMRETQGKKTLSSSGKTNILVVPVEFDHDDSYGFSFQQGTLNILDYMYFGDTGETQPSVKDFYKTSSYGNLEINGVTAPKFVYSKHISEVINSYSANGAASVVSDILDAVYDKYFVETKKYNVEDFDADKDGKVDGIVLAYSWANSIAFANYDIYNYVYGFLENMTYFENEGSWNSKVNSTTWISAIIPDLTEVIFDSHIYIEEMGKMLGLPSYQDLTGDINGKSRMPLAFLDRMDGFIGDHNPFTKYLLGWVNPKTIYTESALESEVVKLRPFESSGDCLLLAPSMTGMFGEYLLVTYYTPTGLNKLDANEAYIYYGSQLYTKPGIRVYAVDARLVEGKNSSNVSLIDYSPDFSKSEIKGYYDFAFSNSGQNKYGSCGVFETYPLIGELSKNELNRHFVDYTEDLTDSDLFVEGDVFGAETDLEFYKNYQFHGNGISGDALGLTFSVDSLGETAQLTVRRAK